jgi:adapter protein MecA 1/2
LYNYKYKYELLVLEVLILKIEKLNENKIKITFDYQDLKDNNIDFQSFMADSEKSKSLFLKILDKAEKTVNFQTEHCKLEFNTIALSNGNFILTITKIDNEENTYNCRKKVHVRRKTNTTKNTFSVYRFSSFDYFLDFCNFLEHNANTNFINKMENKNSLFKFGSLYFFAVSTNNMSNSQKEFLFSTITEFGNFVSNSPEFFAKVKENSFCFLEKNAIKACI